MGEPGIGKSSVIRAMCEENGWHFFELLCNQLGDRTDLTGCRSVKSVQTVNGKEEEIWNQIFFPHQSVQDAITCAKNNPDDTVVLFLDEINRTSSDITSAILSFTTARKIGTYVFPDNVRFIVAGNDKGNITALDSASISRFSKYKLKPSAQSYMDFEENLNPYIKQVLTANPSYIFGKTTDVVTSTVSNDDGDSYEAEYEVFDDNAEGFEQITTPRTISGLNAFLNACSPDKLTYYLGQISRDADTGEETSLLQTIVEGHVGKTLFAVSLCSVIADDVSRGMLQRANTVAKPKKPAVYNSILKCSDRQTRDTMLQSLSDDDKSAVLVYAVWEKGVDNSDIICAVAQQYGGQLLTGDYQPQFTKLKSNDELDADNYAALINSNTTIGTMMRNILGD
ncbi:AAA family ATPase [bacterium]|nr:AAA family ATPase [bacterium]